MRIAIHIFSIIFFLFCTGFSRIQTSDDTNAHIKATFLYNFTRYIEWPLELKKGDFVIAIIGNTPLFNELGKVKDATTRGNQIFAINKYLSVKTIEKCHILFVAKDQSHKIAEIVKRFKDKPTLIITESPGLIEKGAGINFVIKDNKHGFEINKGNIAAHGLSMASNLATFATKVL
ncbi:MAG TPA: YfiR family protein [Flavobacteriales bacterium]|nr:YfiR family protein [Flavobacteriales bacterium]HIN39521.1 YfiR family protein [Flavobacteriales bacterium]